MQFGLMLRAQFPEGDDMAARFRELLEQARLADALGYRDVEFLAFGTTQKERMTRFEENPAAVRRLWTEDSVDMVASHFTLKAASASPRPVQKPHPPIWIGANADPAIRRAARLGDCWYVNAHNRVETIVRQVEVYRRALDEYGKPFPARREVFVAPIGSSSARRTRSPSRCWPSSARPGPTT